MRAVTFGRFGGPEVLEVLDLAEPGPGQVRIRVAAAAVNPTDIGFRSRRQQSAQATSAEPPYIPGMDLAGVVDAVDASVTDWQPGERVMAIVSPRRPRAAPWRSRSSCRLLPSLAPLKERASRRRRPCR